MIVIKVPAVPLVGVKPVIVGPAGVGGGVPPPPPPYVQLNVALTPPLWPLIVNGDVLEKWPLMGSGVQVGHSLSVPEKFPLPSTVPEKAPDGSAQCPFRQENEAEPEEVPAGVVEEPVQLYVPL